MKKLLKSLFLFILAIFVLGNGYILLSGNTYLYTVFQMTIFKGRMGPSIDEYPAFYNREVAVGDPQPWPNSASYNSNSITPELQTAHEEYQSVAYVVIQHDSVIHESYWDGYSDSSRSNSFSMAKSIVAACIGAAIEQGYIEGVNQPVSDFFPRYGEEYVERPITIKDLLNMSAGINFDEDYLNPLAYPARANYGEDLRELNERYTPDRAPGKVFSYQSGESELLSFILSKATGMTVSEYASKALWEPMGAEHPALWSLDGKEGDEKAFCCFNSNARDFARFGSLYLNYGNWKGEQLIDSAFVATSRTPATFLQNEGSPESMNTEYSQQWWTYPDYKGKYQVFFMRGILGQYVFVVPELDLVIVRLGHKRSSERTNGYPNDIYEWLDGGIALAK